MNNMQPTRSITEKRAKTVHLEIIIRGETEGEFLKVSGGVLKFVNGKQMLCLIVLCSTFFTYDKRKILVLLFVADVSVSVFIARSCGICKK